MKNSGLGLLIMESMFREQVDPRRRQEKRDSELLSKSSSSVSNLPAEPICRTWNPSEQVEHFKYHCD
jgi:hypothetical protein